MPTYSYICDNCNSFFEMFYSIKDYIEHPSCASCKSSKTARCYQSDLASLNTSIKKADSELKTVGDLANRNRDRMSQDHKIALHKKHNAYKEEQSTKELPTGMSRIEKPITKTQWH